MTPTARTLKALKKLGFEAGVVERFNSFTKRRHDLFGCIDIVCCYPGVGVLGIQATGGSGGNHAMRRAKACAEPRLRTWLESGGRFEVWSWAKQGARGKRKVWTMRREEIRLDDLTSDPNEAADAGKD